jgi:hypothetical protein
MPYNPTVNDRSGEILAQHQINSAETQAAGNNAFANSLMEGATSAIGSIAGAYTQTKCKPPAARLSKISWALPVRPWGFQTISSKCSNP